MEKTIDQAVEFSSSVLDSAQKVFEGVTSSLKPGIDVALPIAKQAGEQAVKIASPAISEASKKAQEAIQSTGIDTEPVLSVAKVWTINFLASFPPFNCLVYVYIVWNLSFDCFLRKLHGVALICI